MSEQNEEKKEEDIREAQVREALRLVKNMRGSIGNLTKRNQELRFKNLQLRARLDSCLYAMTLMKLANGELQRNGGVEYLALAESKEHGFEFEEGRQDEPRAEK